MKKAFTLAEVLITLGVIGIVAALTMPALIANYQKKQTVTQLQKAYSVLNQVLSAASVEYGTFEITGTTLADAEEFLNKYFLPNLKATQVCVPLSQCGIDITTNATYSTLDGTRLPGFDRNATSVAAIMPDGSTLMLIPYSTAYYLAYIDINGKKGPNTLGKDLFQGMMFQNDALSKGFQFLEEGWKDQVAAREGFFDCTTGYESYCCKADSQGKGCGALIQYDGWEIKDDYPW